MKEYVANEVVRCKKEHDEDHLRSLFSPIGIHDGQTSDCDGDTIVLHMYTFCRLNYLCMLRIARECNSKKPGRNLYVSSN